MATLANAANAESLGSAVTAKLRNVAARGPGYTNGVATIKQVVTLAATDLQDTDSVDILVFPPRCFLLGLNIKITEVDTGADALVFDINADSDTLINATTIGQAGGNDELDANLDPALLDVSGSTLKFVPTTSAGTGAAGTLTVWATVNLNGVIDTW